MQCASGEGTLLLAKSARDFLVAVAKKQTKNKTPVLRFPSDYCLHYVKQMQDTAVAVEYYPWALM